MDEKTTETPVSSGDQLMRFIDAFEDNTTF